MGTWRQWAWGQWGYGRDVGKVGMGTGTVQDPVDEEGIEAVGVGLGTVGWGQNTGDGGDMGPVKMELEPSRTLVIEGMLDTGAMVRASLGLRGLKGHRDSRDTVRDTLGPQGWGHGDSGNGLRDSLETSG